MSDRTPGSVRSASPAGDDAAPKDSGTGTPPATATQSIPGTGAQRAQAATAAAQGRPADAGLGVTSSREAADPGATGAVPATAGDTARPVGKPVVGKTGGRPGRVSGKAAGRGPRRARLQLRHIDTWSALKISLVLSIA